MVDYASSAVVASDDDDDDGGDGDGDDYGDVNYEDLPQLWDGLSL